MRIDHGSWRVVEFINKDDTSLTHNYVVDTNSSGLYEIKVQSNKPETKIDELKKDLLAQFNALAIYY